MRIAILGATSQIAKDLILSFAKSDAADLTLYARNASKVSNWKASVGLANRYSVQDLNVFQAAGKFDAVLNFIGIGDPAKAIEMGVDIFNVTFNYDQMVLNYLRNQPKCKYLFMSSGAAYGSNFTSPVNDKTYSHTPLNNLKSHDWYGVAKLYAECRHRAFNDLPIIDIRIFNYFSHTQDLDARFLITDILRSIRQSTVFTTSDEVVFRDFIHPDDFFNLIKLILHSDPVNIAVDCYSAAPIEKKDLLETLRLEFNLKYEIRNLNQPINATGTKSHYFSLNKKAEVFGYKPTLSSMDAIVREFRIILNRDRHS